MSQFIKYTKNNKWNVGFIVPNFSLLNLMLLKVLVKISSIPFIYTNIYTALFNYFMLKLRSGFI